MYEPIASFNDWISQYDAAQFIWTVVGVLAALGLIWKWAKKAVPSVKSGIAFLEALAELPVFISDTRSFITSVGDDISLQRETLEQVRHEVLPNNGGSMRDDLETLALQVEEMRAHQVNDYKALQALQTELAARRERRDRALSTREESGEDSGGV